MGTSEQTLEFKVQCLGTAGTILPELGATNMETKTIGFTLNELLLMERAISYNSPRTILAVPPITDQDLTSLTLKVGFALVNATEDSLAEVSLTEKECWWFRETIDVLSRIGKGPEGEGYSIKKKLYAAMLEFDLEFHVNEVTQPSDPTSHEVKHGK